MNPHIFREYDIRGVVERDLSGDVPFRIGRAFAVEILRDHAEREDVTVVVGHDNRPSSPELATRVREGLRKSGIDVIDIGEVPTPVLYWAATHYGAAGAMQITGSHNPPEYNGFKMVSSQRDIFGPAIQQMRQTIERGAFRDGAAEERRERPIPAYIADVTQRFAISRPLKVVVDCGNGVGSLVATQLLGAIGAQVVPLYCESDGTFPNHHPDPTVDDYIQDLIATVREEHADVGIGFDGDADRLGVVDEHGDVVRGDLLLLLFGLDLIERKGPGQKLIFDVKCSQAVPEVFAAAGGEPIMWKTGHSLIKQKMRETGAPIAGELSGHICFADDYYGFDDAPYAACRLVDLLARKGRPLSELIGEFPRYVATPEMRVDVTEELKWEIVRAAVDHFRRDHEVVDIDGARVLFDGGWGLLRASNTQPVLVMRFEARDQQTLDEIRRAFEEYLHGQGVGLTAHAGH
ncbi:MAG: phosphomannomutase/phosphoglucomutase [Longimicrobiales bacterium]